MDPDFHSLLARELRLDLLLRLLLASVLGGLIGLEREISGKPAGLRTNLLICVGAALFTELSIGVADLANAQHAAQGTPFRADPSRIAAQIVSGVGFIGAGTILQARRSIIGLTSAATIWVVAAIGMAVGAGAYLEAAGTTLLVAVSLMALGRLEDNLKGRRFARRYTLVLDPDPALLDRVEEMLREAGLQVRTDSLEKRDASLEVSLELAGPARLHEEGMRMLIRTPGVHRVSRGG